MPFQLFTTIYLFSCDIILLLSFIFPSSVSCLTLPFVVFLRCGTAVNYVAISEALGVSPSVLAAGLTADNVICAVYFTTLFALASKIPPETSMSTNGAKNYMLLWLTLSLWQSRWFSSLILSSSTLILKSNKIQITPSKLEFSP